MILLVDKPAGMTSQQVVSKIKYAAREKYGKIKIGHTGTLDPMCTGLLPVLTGRHTSLSDLFPATKAYRAGLLLGRTTDTEDVTGKTLSEGEVAVPEEEVFAVASSFLGEQMQTPPMVSALKVNGERLYALARKGIEVEREPRKITVFSLLCTSSENRNEYILEVSCSSGTYIRTLCADIGKKLGCGGCMSFLRRTASNGFSLDQAYSLDRVVSLAEEGKLEEISIPAERAFSSCEKVVLPASGQRYYLNGGTLSSDRLSPSLIRSGLLRAYSEKGAFLGLGRFAAEDGMFRKVWAEL